MSGLAFEAFGASTRHLLPGDPFEFDREVPHAERFGKDGATHWAARRNR